MALSGGKRPCLGRCVGAGTSSPFGSATRRPVACAFRAGANRLVDPWAVSTEGLPSLDRSDVGSATGDRSPSGLTGRRLALAVSRLGRHAAIGQDVRVATYELNLAAVERARAMIGSRQYVLDSDWGTVQPRAEAENAFLARHSFEEYAAWHLGLTEGATDGTKARYAFVYGDFRRVHRSGLIACVYRASEWRHKDVELAAHELLQELDRKAGIS